MGDGEGKSRCCLFMQTLHIFFVSYRALPVAAVAYTGSMTRRTKLLLAEKISLALLTKAAFGRDAGIYYAKLVSLPMMLVIEIFGRPVGRVRKGVAGVQLVKDRRKQNR